jgi:hypothetical protein
MAQPSLGARPTVVLLIPIMTIFKGEKNHGLLGLRLKFEVVFGIGFLLNFYAN